MNAYPAGKPGNHTGGMDSRNLLFLALSGAVLFAAKSAMAFLPGLEPVTLLTLVYTSVLGRRAFYPVFVLIGLDIFVYGLNLWVIQYLYVWPLLVLVVLLLHGLRTPLGAAVLAGTFGLFFGALCALPHLLLQGWAFALSWWVAGIPFDLAHCAGNVVLALVLYAPCRKLYARLACDLQGAEA